MTPENYVGLVMSICAALLAGFALGLICRGAGQPKVEGRYCDCGRWEDDPVWYRVDADTWEWSCPECQSWNTERESP